jgi:hypothetical protein
MHATMTERAVMLYNLVIVQAQIAGFAATPYPARQRHIALSAHFLLQDIHASTMSSNRSIGLDT